MTSLSSRIATLAPFTRSIAIAALMGMSSYGTTRVGVLHGTTTAAA